MVKIAASKVFRRVEAERLSTSVRLSEVAQHGFRLEASAYGIEAAAVIERLRVSKLPLMKLYSEDGLCKESHNAFRFARVWVDRQHGVSFLSSSDIITMRPEDDAFISIKKTARLDELIIKDWDVLISCSGTIGNVGLASRTLSGKALSQDAIRLRAETPALAGYVAAFLRSSYGRPQLKQATYGSVIQHIEPEHLKRVVIPVIANRERIGEALKLAYELRDQANDLLDEANKKIHSLLQLPELETQSDSAPVNSIRASEIRDRFEAYFHNPFARVAERNLQALPIKLINLGHSSVTSEIRPITKFRKRTYVRRGGIPMLSSKQIFQIDPIDVKRLAKGAHTKDLPEIALKSRMLLITRSGTIGKVQIVPKYMDGWAASEHATRVIAAQDMNEGYLYAWLASQYGQLLIKRHSYGSVILEIDKDMLASIPVPMPSESIRRTIGDLVLRANELRDEAWKIERKAISSLEQEIERV